MCGFVGIFARKKHYEIEKALKVLCHRGPDAQSGWSDSYAMLGHTRLKIIDLSDDANQPFERSPFRIIYNGEIYNYVELRKECENAGVKFRTSSDTEVLLAMYELYGEACLGKLEGMFAFIIYNEQSGKVFGARDRIGEKPFYYSLVNGELFAASEIKAILAFMDTTPAHSREGIMGYLLNTYSVPPPLTAFEGIYRLEPGYCFTFEKGRFEKKKYWDLGDIKPFSGSYSDAVDQLDHLLCNAVRICLAADIPVSTTLSGGVDSSLVTAIAAGLSGKKIKSFALGTSESDPEILRSRRVSEIYDTEHFVTVYDESLMGNALDDIKRIVGVYDEPYSLFAAVYADYLYRDIKRNTTVCLTGNGADEVFGGYRGYPQIAKRLRRLHPFSPLLRLLRKSPFSARQRILGKIYGARDYSTRILNHALYRESHSTGLVLDEFEAPEPYKQYLRTYLNDLEGIPPFSRLIFSDLIFSHHHGVVMLADGVPMQYSLELRSPFLNPRVMEFALSLPEHFLIDPKTGENKKILKSVAGRYLPDEVVHAYKYGFGYSIPWEKYVTGPWKPRILDEVRRQKITSRYSIDFGDIEQCGATDLMLLYNLAAFAERYPG